MEWAVLVACAAFAAVLVAAPLARRTPADGLDPASAQALEEQALVEERAALLAELRELDDDAAAGRISSDDRSEGRRALAPRLRAVVEALRARGIEA